jgi:hypothetical protein
MTIRYHVIGAVAAILGITAPASAYTITSFNIPGSVYLGPVYIAGPGQLAGEYVSSNFVDAGFAATDGSISTFNAPGNEGTFVLGIDSAAQIAVQTDEDAFVYQNGGFKIVSPPQSTQTVIQGINNSGQLVGYYYLGDGGGSSGFTEQGGIYTEINVPGASFTNPTAISGSGVIAGTYDLSSGVMDGFVDAGGTFGTFSLPGSPIYVDVIGVSNSGEVVGTYLTTDDVISGFIYDKGTLELLSDYLPKAVNGSGEIVGTYGAESFVLDNGTLAMFSAPGAGVTIITGIDDAGDVAGIYTNGGPWYGFYATPEGAPQPVGEPTTITLLCSGIVAIGAARRRRSKPSSRAGHARALRVR